jgi:hypothetical protein
MSQGKLRCTKFVNRKYKEIRKTYGHASIVARKRNRNVSAEDIVGLTLMFLNSSSDQAAFTFIFGMVPSIISNKI